MSIKHSYTLDILWTGNRGRGTADYRSYARTHTIQGAGKPPIYASADPAFRGNADCYNPEELLLAALSACHMLWFLHLCADAGVIVLGYLDNPQATMIEETGGEGQFTEAMLRPKIRLLYAVSDELLADLHRRAHKHCFIARSVNFPVLHQAYYVFDIDPDEQG